ncbi:hypothetical protein ACQPX6_22810 [Actinomycetospora sp. CA-101289]|uniref:hypothetical protein n=1 Tax=Actinomycetospora sp. CA-101289 TaxID=3239893 RepID=UPI003D98EDA3
MRTIATQHLDEEARRFTRRTRAVMAVEGALAVALGGAGVVAAATAATATVAVAGFRLGLPQFAVLAGIGVLILASLRSRAALRRAAVVSATVATAMFVAGGVYYPDGAWDINEAGIFLPAAIALAGFVEYVFLSSVEFVSTPSDIPDREAPGRAG